MRPSDAWRVPRSSVGMPSHRSSGADSDSTLERRNVLPRRSVGAREHIWVRWVDAEANPLPSALIETIETADRLAVSAITCWD